jgi:hypothetical protein
MPVDDAIGGDRIGTSRPGGYDPPGTPESRYFHLRAFRDRVEGEDALMAVNGAKRS